nr:hypothetical protein [uncultured Mediterranean phage uvMED]
MAGIKDYSTTQASNTSLNGINTAEGMLPSDLNNAIRALMKNTREWYNDAQWVIYGDGDAAFTSAYVSASSFTINGVDVTAFYHAGRRVKITGSSTGVVYGTISSSSFSTNTTVNVTLDSGTLQNETLTIYLAILTKTGNSIPTDVISAGNLTNNSITTSKIVDDAITNAKIADNAVQAAKINSNAVTEAKINAGAVTATKIGTDAIITSKILDNNVTTSKIPDNAITTAKINADAINGTKIADDSIDSEHLVDGSIDSQHIGADQIITSKIADNNITTAKINNDAVTIGKIADAAIVTSSEQSSHTPDNNTFYTTSASDTRFLNKDTSELINSGQTWSNSDDYIATTAAINARVIDLVDDVGGFVPIANETSFPVANPDPSGSTGTIVSITDAGGLTYNTGTGQSTNAETTAGTTVTITGISASIGSPIASGFGMLVETTSTLNTYTFTRLVPKATEVSTVAANATAIANVNSNSSNINSVAGQISPTNNLSTVAGISSAVSTVAGANSNISTIASDLGGSNNIGTVAGSITNVNNVGGSITNVNQLAGALSLQTTFIVTVVNPGSGNVFAIDGTNNPTITLDRGGTYIFDQSDNTNSGHPLAFKDSSGAAYTTGVTVTGTAGSAGAKVTIVVAANAPSSLRYYCTYHGNGMGNTISVVNNNLTTVAANITNVNNTGNSITNVNLVGASIANVNNVGTNIADVNSFANQYRVVSSDPTSSLDAGDLAYNTSDNNLKYYNGSSWTSIAPGIANVVDDSTPQLGGNLDLNSNNITGTGGIPAANLTGSIAEARLPASALGAVWESKSISFTAEARKNYFVDTTSGTITATLPSSASAGDEIRFLDVSGTFDTNKLTINRNSHKIQGVAADLDVETERAGLGLVYYNATQGWLLKDK